ncbi:protein FAM24A-like [Nycticebus coucang]|uniref:protein FAM24A-like n=1 Tax=Nycticebus coucang TaxID=9470 RepID=UPI00234D3C1E|nr:protein FAM24A-like [Nycticebus coucang]
MPQYTGVAKMFDLKTKIMIGIGISLLIATFVLIGIVLCLYIKLSRALRAARDADAIRCCGNLAKLCWNNKATATGSCAALQCCDGCRMYTDYDSLPPCCCDTNEGL